jgi:hypothetical protein
MSYSNPKIAVDTQSGQHVTNMIKSVSDSYGKFAASEAKSLVGLEKAKAEKAAKAEEAEALRIKKEQARMAEADAKSEEYAGMLHSVQATALDIDLNQAQEGIDILHGNAMKDKSLLTSEQRQAIAKQNAIVKNAPSIIKEGIASMQEFTDYYEEVRKKQQGEYGSLYVGDFKNDEQGNKASPNAMYDALIGHPDTKAEVKGHMDYSTGIFTVEVFKDGVSIGKMTPGSEDNMRKPQIVPNMHKKFEAMNKKIASTMQLGDSNSPAYAGQPDIAVKHKDGIHYKRLPNKDIYKKAAAKEVEATVGSMNAGDLIALYNTKINPDANIEYKKEWGKDDKATIDKIKEGMVGFLMDNHGQNTLAQAANFGTVKPPTDRVPNSTEINRAYEIDDVTATIQNTLDTKTLKAGDSQGVLDLLSSMALDVGDSEQKNGVITLGITGNRTLRINAKPNEKQLMEMVSQAKGLTTNEARKVVAKTRGKKYTRLAVQELQDKKYKTEAEKIKAIRDRTKELMAASDKINLMGDWLGFEEVKKK